MEQKSFHWLEEKRWIIWPNTPPTYVLVETLIVQRFRAKWKPLRPTLDEGPGSNFLGINLDWFEANWILELDSTLVPSRILGSPNEELSF
jgi:hypothetical protein